ncbi:MAG TPA: helix-turn-helix domain-containing protein [Longimicrobium sp.]|jgi:AraC-like DNA-binding protein
MGDLLLLSPAPSAMDTLRSALRRQAAGGVHHVVRTSRGWSDLTALAIATPAAVAFVDPYHDGAFAATEIRRLRARAPGVEVVALADFHGRPPTDGFALAQLGVRGIVCVRRDGPDAVVRVLDALVRRGPLDEMVAALAEVVPASVHRWLGPMLVSPADPGSVPALARLAGQGTARTLGRLLAAEGLPAAAELLAWRRLLHAARLLEDGRSVAGAAAVLEFSSASALRKSLRRVAGLRPAELAASGGVRRLAHLFVARCRSGAPR